MLASDAAEEFLNSLVFPDSKRPITADILRRLSFVELARELGRLDELQRLVQSDSGTEGRKTQMSLLMEATHKYRTGPRRQRAPARGLPVKVKSKVKGSEMTNGKFL